MPVGVWVAVERHTVQMASLRSGVFCLRSVEGETKKQSHLTQRSDEVEDDTAYWL